MQVDIDGTQDMTAPVGSVQVCEEQETRRESKSRINRRPTVLHMSCKVNRSDLAKRAGCACLTDYARLRKAAQPGQR